MLVGPSEHGHIDTGGLARGHCGALKVGIIALAALTLMVIVVAICWFAGWRTASHISTGLTWAGVAAIAAGVLSTMGRWGLTQDSGVMYAQSVSQQTMPARTRQGLGDTLRSYNLAIVAPSAGILCFVVGALI